MVDSSMPPGHKMHEDGHHEMHDSSFERIVERNPKVSFTTISIREYKMTVGDHPCCQYGPPTSLDWEYEEVYDSSLDEYEATRSPRRKHSGMVLYYRKRTSILMAVYGFTEDELRRATKQKDFCRFQRQVTNTFSSIWRVEDALESLRRKTKRILVSVRKRVSVRNSQAIWPDVKSRVPGSSRRATSEESMAVTEQA